MSNLSYRLIFTSDTERSGLNKNNQSLQKLGSSTFKVLFIL